MTKFDYIKKFMQEQTFKNDAKFEIKFQETSGNYDNQCSLVIVDMKNNERMEFIYIQDGNYCRLSVFNDKAIALIDRLNCRHLTSEQVCLLILTMINNFLE